MNRNMDDRVVYITQTYDYLPGPLPAGWQDIKPVWFDASNCWTGEVAAPQENGAFTIQSEPWVPNFEGRIVDAVGVSSFSLPLTYRSRHVPLSHQCGNCMVEFFARRRQSKDPERY